MADHQILSKVHSLSDVELACLLSLMSNEHCIISTPASCLDDLVTELRLVSERTFGLRSAVVECTPHTTLDEFASALLLPTYPASPTTPRSFSPYLARSPQDSYFPRTTNATTQPTTSPPGVHNHSYGSPSTAQHHHHHHQMPPLMPASLVAGEPLQSQIANVILAKNLDQAPKAVQIQALELIRTHRIFTKTSVQTAPKTFMLVAVLGAESGGDARVTPHLNDFFYIAHWVDPDEEGFTYLYGDNDDDDDGGRDYDDEAASLASSQQEQCHRQSPNEAGDNVSIISSAASVVKRRSRAPTSALPPTPHQQQHQPLQPLHSPRSPISIQSRARSRNSTATFPSSPSSTPPLFPTSELTHLRQLTHDVSIDIDVTRYQMNIVSFLRMHRAVGGGITPQATRHFEMLMRSLAPLHGIDYVTPALVCLAARKVYLHRIAMVEPSKERSMQWGSDLAAIERLLEGWGPEDVVEDVLQLVGAPV